MPAVGQAGALEDMESMPALVQQGLDVVVHADGIGKDERALGNGKIGAVGAGRLALAVIQVQQVLAAHDLEIFAQLRIDGVEDG